MVLLMTRSSLYELYHSCLFLCTYNALFYDVAGVVSQFTMDEHRVEIDTSLPFKSVRAAVHLFDDKKDVKKFKLPEVNILLSFCDLMCLN